MTDTFHPPGLADDFARRPDKQEAFARGWDAIVNSWLDECTGLDGGTFYNPHKDDTEGQPNTAAVPWDAFPRFLEKWFEDDPDTDQCRWQAADTLRPRRFGGQPLRRVKDNTLLEAVPTFHRQQDEYCEWFVHRDGDGRISRVTFTSEGPEYWMFLAAGTSAYFAQDDERSGIVEGDIELVAELYREHVDTSVTVDDLVWPYDVAAFDRGNERWYLYGRGGTYNPFNKWNTTHGAMHLTHPANTLGAEVTLAAQAATLRVDGEGKPLVDTEELICRSGYGDPNRSSDPSIGAGVNAMARDGFSISLADPVGLYLAGINLDAFEAPGGADLSHVWRVDRGVADRKMILRATFAPPPGAGFTVEEIRATGTPIAYGGQIADEIQMILTGLAKARGATPAPQSPVAKCCQHPRKPGIQTIVEPTDDCSSVNWDGLAPLLPADAQTASPEAAEPQPLAALVEPDPQRTPLARGR